MLFVVPRSSVAVHRQEGHAVRLAETRGIEEGAMPIAAAVGETLVSLDQLDEVADTSGDTIRDFVAKSETDADFAVTVDGNVTIGAADLAKAREAKSSAMPYEGIGVGKPLTIVIETIYLGDYPDAMPWVPYFQGGDVLVTSAHKAFESFDAAPRAVHLLEKNAKRRASLKAKAPQQGSQLVYYSPAVTGLSILFSVELSLDRDFSKEIGDALAKAVTGAGALPVFAPAAPYLVAAGVAIPIASKAVNMLARPQTFFGEHVELNFARPGVELAQPGALLLYGGSDERAFDGYKLRGLVLRDGEGRPYSGELPYAVISLDGTEHREFDEWSATAASAALLERFFTSDELISEALEVVSESLVLYNDMTYRDKAAEALEKSKAMKGAKKKQQEELYKAYVKNIKTKELRETVEKDGGTT
jgi:hypothetical protein